MTKTSHPFFDGLKTIPEGKHKELQKIRNWLLTQPHLPTISDDFVYLFLHACYYDLTRTKYTIDRYFTIRSKTPMLFANRDVDHPTIQTCIELAHVVRLPKLTPDGYKVLMYTCKDPDYTKLVFADAVKGFCMFNDCALSEDGLAEGYIVLFDMKGVSLGHLARVSLPPLKAFLNYIQEAHPARLKQIHVLNTANYINHIMRIILPLVRSEFLSFVKFHKGNVPEGIPIEIMPKDYGGEAPTVKELDEESLSMVDKYRDWLKDSEKYQVDETKRIKKGSWWGGLFGYGQQTIPNNNNMALVVDGQQKVYLKDLQID